jgi:hypothetical protein
MFKFIGLELFLDVIKVITIERPLKKRKNRGVTTVYRCYLINPKRRIESCSTEAVDSHFTNATYQRERSGIQVDFFDSYLR